MGSTTLASRGIGPATAALAALAYLAWLAAAIALLYGLWFPPFVHLFKAAVQIGVPAAGVAFVVLRRAPTPTVVRAWVWAVAATAGALYAAGFVDRQPYAVVALPFIAATGLFALRHPTAVLGTAFVLTGAYGSITAFTPVEPGPIVDLMLAGMWTALVFRWVGRGRDRALVWWPGTVLAGAYLFATFLFIPFAPDAFEAVRAYRTSAWYMLAALLVAYAGLRPAQLKRLADVVVVVGLLVGAYATFRWSVGPAGVEEDLARGGGTGNYIRVGGELKVFGSLTSGAELGAWSATVIPFCLAIALGGKGRIRLLAAAAVPLLTVGLLGSELRIGLAAIVLACVVVFALNQIARGFPSLRLGTAGVALLGCVVGAIVIFPAVVGDNPASLQRYKNLLTPERDFSFQERRFKWSTALEEIDDRPFGRGIGTGGIRQRNQRFLTGTLGDIDSSYLKVAYEQGFLLLGLFAAAVAAMLLGLMRRAVWTTSAARAPIAVGACGSLVAFSVCMASALFIDLLPALTAWLIVGLGIAQFTSLPRAKDDPA